MPLGSCEGVPPSGTAFSRAIRAVAPAPVPRRTRTGPPLPLRVGGAGTAQTVEGGGGLVGGTEGGRGDVSLLGVGGGRQAADVPALKAEVVSGVEAWSAEGQA